MSLLFDPDALSGIPKQECKRIISKAEWFWVHRKDVIHHPLSSNLSRYFKRTVGPYRMIYEYDKNADDLIVVLAGLRDKIYDIAAKILRSFFYPSLYSAQLVGDSHTSTASKTTGASLSAVLSPS